VNRTHNLESLFFDEVRLVFIIVVRNALPNLWDAFLAQNFGNDAANNLSS
jgi:hypothetical protein